MSYGDALSLFLCVVLTAAIVYIMMRNSSAGPVVDSFVQHNLPPAATMALLHSVSNVKKVEHFQVEGVVEERVSDESSPTSRYDLRRFVLKQYESIGRKPSTDEIDRIAAIGDRIKIMEHMIDVAANGVDEDESAKMTKKRQSRESFRDDDERPEEDKNEHNVVPVDADDLYENVDVTAAAPKKQKPVDYDGPAPFAPDEPNEQVVESIDAKVPTTRATPTTQTTTNVQPIRATERKNQEKAATHEKATPTTAPRSEAKECVQDMFSLLSRLDGLIA